MKIFLTGASGRVGRAIYTQLSKSHQVVGFDRIPSPFADVVGDLRDGKQLAVAARGAEAFVHVAALHAPHVGQFDAATFDAINVRGTHALATLARETGVRHFIFTSTTALYGVPPESAESSVWVDELTVPQPRTVYHHSKLAAEALLAEFAAEGAFAVSVLRMSRCFPEPAPLMALYRLHRGIDARDVAAAHEAALNISHRGYRCWVISGPPPFLPDDAAVLGSDARAVLLHRAPELVRAFAARGWTLPVRVDRVYDPARARVELGWQAQYGFDEVLRQFDAGSSEVLPPQ